MNQVGFLNSFDACVGHAELKIFRVYYKDGGQSKSSLFRATTGEKAIEVAKKYYPSGREFEYEE